MSLPFRWMNWLYAQLFSYYWAPCPICGRMYGGHESAQVGLMSGAIGRCICNDPKCVSEALRRNQEAGYGAHWFGKQGEIK